MCAGDVCSELSKMGVCFSCATKTTFGFTASSQRAIATMPKRRIADDAEHVVPWMTTSQSGWRVETPTSTATVTGLVAKRRRATRTRDAPTFANLNVPKRLVAAPPERGPP
jgi:hypothetical protein